MDRLLVAGGGIGGVAAALALARKNISTIVLEQAPELGEIGAGIQIAPNAFHCFDRLGVGDRARSEAVYVDRLRLMDGLSGEEIVHIPLDTAFRERFRNPYAVVHRADLHLALLEAAKKTGLVDIRTNHRVERYDQDGTSVTVYCAGREPVRGAALIGADGLRSPVREQMLGDGEPIVSGHTTYRSVIPTDQMPEDLRWNAATLWAGPKCHIVHYPLKGWKVFNLVVTYHNDVKEAVAGKAAPVEEVKRGFAHVHPRAQRIIEHGSNWKLWVLCDREPADRWVDGRVALLGDAAHPMLQYFAQGRLHGDGGRRHLGRVRRRSTRRYRERAEGVPSAARSAHGARAARVAVDRPVHLPPRRRDSDGARPCPALVDARRILSSPGLALQRVHPP